MDLKKYVEKEVNISSSPALQYAQDYIDSNHLYMRLASTEVFAISRDVGHKMMTGEYSGEEVRRIMDWLVNVKEDGSNPIQHRNLMPVTSGMEYTVTETERGKFWFRYCAHRCGQFKHECFTVCYNATGVGNCYYPGCIYAYSRNPE